MNLRSFVFISIPFICFILGYAFCSWYLGNQTYPTPDLIGLGVHDALLKTSPLHLNLQLIAQKQHPTLAPGTIISQKPIPNRRIKQHQSILITISTAPGVITAPDAAKMELSELQQWCKEHNVTMKEYKVPSSLPHNHFVAQSPGYNEYINNQALLVYYSDNQSHLFLMPNFYHQNINSVLSVLEHYNLNVEIFYKNAICKDIDHSAFVTAQKPSPATVIDTNKKPMIQLEILI